MRELEIFARRTSKLIDRVCDQQQLNNRAQKQLNKPHVL